MSLPTRQRGGSGALAAAVLIAFFVVLQALTLDYGTRINDLPHIAGYRVSGDVMSGSGLERGQLVSGEQFRPETLDLSMLRFKLYSVEADEIVNIIALARIRPAEGRLDPGFYQYGGAFLYPLGLWYFAWSKAGVLPLGTIEDLLADPQRMDRVWLLGRAFMLLAFALSAAVLFATLRRISRPGVALLCTGIYLFCPASIAFSQIMKPHWYALLWVNLALFGLVRAFTSRAPPSIAAEIAIAVPLGLAVGTATTFGIFAVLVWCALAMLAWLNRGSIWALIRVPIIALIAFAASNPYYFLNWQAMRAESMTTAAGWFTAPSFNPALLLQYVDNALFTGMGVAATVLLLAAIAWRLASGRPPRARWAALAVLLPLVVAAFITESMAFWHTNLRYAAYAVPMAMLLFAAFDFPGRTGALAAVLFATFLQSVPLKLAYFDEDDPRFSTRLAAAAWIDANIPAGSAVCLGTRTATPYDVPPFDIGRHRINAPDCTWTVRVERETDRITPDPGLAIAQRFRPRLSPERFPLVFGHINPQITVYRRADSGG